MTVDGFEPSDKDAFVAYSPGANARFARVLNRWARILKIEVEGVDNLPAGRCLLVANHAFGWDVIFAAAAIYERTGRTVWGLGEHAWWRVPYLRKLASRLGMVDGTQENAACLLDREQIVLVLPGGLREAVKPKELRYRLLWGHRYGFVKAAIAHRAPIVPLASVGTDELFDFVGNPYARGERWLGKVGIPIPLPSRILPIPHRVAIKLLIGKPIAPNVAPEAADDPDVLRRVRHEVAGALHELIDEELARRVGMPMGHAHEGQFE